jgi:hypothetical protein
MSRENYKLYKKSLYVVYLGIGGHMNFTKYLAKVFEEELEKVFNKEKLEVGFLNQEQFETCSDRVKKAFEIAIERPVQIGILATSTHRTKKHDEDRTGEILESQSKLSIQEDIVRAKEAGENPDVWT